MLFNSLEFALFFPLVCTFYFVLPYRLRTPLLLLASCVFYMAFIPAYILILLITILIDYFAGIYLERVTGPPRAALLSLSIVATCMVLFVFKYFIFITGTFVALANLAGTRISVPALNIILPIGLSFHTFQSLSYVIEVYYGRQKAERNFITYATYVMFFPQLVAGPIERPQNLLHQFYEHHRFDYSRVTAGLRRMAWGFFKKLVVADRLALYVNDVYNDIHKYNGLQISVATFFFAYQIYCDFSGYTDIALGAAQVLGFKLMENFDTPYYASSVSEFWRRWHISLSTWFRDYIYFPLGGNRVRLSKWIRNILITFALSGLWHGSNWTYVIWGLLNGFYIIFGTLSLPWRTATLKLMGVRRTPFLKACTQIPTTFALTLVAWVLFRSKSLADALYVYTHWFSGWDLHSLKTPQFQLKYFPAAVLALLLLESIQLLRKRADLKLLIFQLPTYIRWPIYMAFLFLIIFFGVYRSEQFIYFQF